MFVHAFDVFLGVGPRSPCYVVQLVDGAPYVPKCGGFALFLDEVVEQAVDGVRIVLPKENVSIGFGEFFRRRLCGA